MRKQLKLIDKTSQRTLLPQLQVAKSLAQRFLGLMFRSPMPNGFGLWIIPCKSIHTMWMRFPIDVFFVDQEGKVLECRRNVPPWRIVFACRGTHSVLETPAGSAKIAVGTNLASMPANESDQ